MDKILELVDLYFSYGQTKPILKGLNLQLLPLQNIALVGANGSGKTTLLRCLTGLLPLASGQIFLSGQKISTEADFHHLRCQVGFVLQDAESQLFFPSVLEDLMFGPLNLGYKVKDAKNLALATLDSLSLGYLENALTYQLSGGEKRLIAIAAILAMRPKILLLDEPTNDLDQDAKNCLLKVLQNLDIAKIIVSHDQEFLKNLATSQLTLIDGKLQIVN